MGKKQASDSEDIPPVSGGSGGKVDNDTNKTGHQKPTQKNEGQRTPQSRHDRETHVGGSNQTQARKGGTGGGGKRP